MPFSQLEKAIAAKGLLGKPDVDVTKDEVLCGKLAKAFDAIRDRKPYAPLSPAEANEIISKLHISLN